jgi:C-terminal processing protease CtpA/Prc
MKIIVILFLFISLSKLNAQTDYTKIFTFAIQQVEANYPGFETKYKADSAYYKYLKNKMLSDSIITINDLLSHLKSYLNFFKDKHLGIRYTKIYGSNSNRNAEIFSFSQIEKDVSYLKFNSFNTNYTSQIDSVIKSNYKKITSSDYLIIDIRGNGGGGDRCYRSIIPLLYTNPISGINIEVYASEDNIKHTKVERRNENLNSLMDANKGGFVPIFGRNYIHTEDYKLKQLKKPKFIAIVTDRNVGSAAERFVLTAKQSKKTKIFGENTSGCIDYTNVRYINLIKDELFLGMPTTRTMNLPLNKIDEVGIVPDFYLDLSSEPIQQVLKIIKN